MKPEAHLLQQENYPFTVELQTRFGDLDPHQHINNVAIVRLFEESRVRFDLFAHGALEDRDGLTRRVVLEVTTRYLAEIFHEGSIAVGVGVTHIGNTSYQVACAMFQQGRCVAFSKAVLVGSDGVRSQPLPGAMKADLVKFPVRQQK